MLLTHHTLKNRGKQAMPLRGGATKLEPIKEAGSGSVQEKEKALLDEIIQKVNDLFEGDLTDQDKLVYVNNVIKGKLLESETLRQQAANNTKEQFANSPDLKTELLNAIMGALDAHTTMSTQGTEFGDRAARPQGYPAQQRGPLRDAARQSGQLAGGTSRRNRDSTGISDRKEDMSSRVPAVENPTEFFQRFRELNAGSSSGKRVRHAILCRLAQIPA